MSSTLVTVSVRSWSFHTDSKLKRGREIFKYGAPLRGADVLYYSNHALCYDQSKKIPLWVAEHLTPERMQGKRGILYLLQS